MRKWKRNSIEFTHNRIFHFPTMSLRVKKTTTEVEENYTVVMLLDIQHCVTLCTSYYTPCMYNVHFIGVQSGRLHLSQGRCWQRNVYRKKRSFISGGWRWYYSVGNIGCWFSIWRGFSIGNCRKSYWKSTNCECSFIRYVIVEFFFFSFFKCLRIH